MKPAKAISHESTLPKTGVTRMSMDMEDFAHIMGVLTDMYSDTMLASIREYASNAWDAHVAAGNTDPIQVTLPDAFNPSYEVVDYGPGMSLEELEGNYSKYGWSSKRGTNAESGMLGIGCKSALTYTNQFVVKSVKDGVRNTIIISRDEDGVGSLQVLSTSKTDEANGTTVTIPVKDYASFRTAAFNFFSFWEEGTVLIDGNPPEPFHTHDGVRQFSDNVWTHQAQGVSRVVMGNINYPLDTKIIKIDGLNFARNQGSVIIKVPIGSVNFAPSREALRYDKRTKDYLNQAINDAAKSVSDKIQADVSGAPSASEAAAKAIYWSKLFRDTDFTWQGKPFPIVHEFGIGETCRYLQFNDPASLLANRSDAWNNKLSFGTSIGCINVVNFTSPSVYASLKRHIRDMIFTEDGKRRAGMDRVNQVFFWNECPWGEFLDPAKTLDLSVTEIKPEKSKSSSPSYKDRLPHYTSCVSRGYSGAILTRHEEYPADKTVLWIPRGVQNGWRFDDMVKPIKGRDDIIVLVVSKPQREKFIRCHPDAIPLEDYLKEIGKHVWGKMSEQDMHDAHFAPDWALNLAGFPADKRPAIDDPVIAAKIEWLSKQIPVLFEVRKLPGSSHATKDFAASKSVWTKLIKPYEMLSGPSMSYGYIWDNKGKQRLRSAEAHKVARYLNAMYYYTQQHAEQTKEAS